MKILVTWHSGVEKNYYRFFEELKGQDNDILVCLPDKWTEGGQLVRYNSKNESIKTCVFKTVFNDHIRAFFYPNFFKMIQIIRKFKPDILHIMEEPFSIAASEWLLAGKLSGLKIKTILYSAENIDVYQKFPYSAFQKYNLKTADAIAFVPQESETIWRSRGFKNEMKKIYLGIDTSQFKKKDIIRQDTGFVIGYTGRIVPEKGLDTLLEAGLILNKKAHFRFKIKIIGSGVYRKNLEDRSIQSGLKDLVEFKPAVDSTDLADLYSGLDALVLPSLTTSTWKEQFGRVIPEAMACGVPVIGSDSGEIPYVIGDTGFVFREGNAEDLALKISELIENKPRRDEIIREGLIKAEKEYSWKAIARQYTGFYYELINSKEVV